jgi:hypothetical protein
MRLRRLVLLDFVLLIASLPGLLNVLAKDHVSTAEGVVAWISFIVLVASLMGLLALTVVAVRRVFAKPS